MACKVYFRCHLQASLSTVCREEGKNTGCGSDILVVSFCYLRTAVNLGRKLNFSESQVVLVQNSDNNRT